MNTIFSTSITYFSGLITGILGTYIATRLSDKAKERDSKKSKIKRFVNVKNKMPELIGEMKTDLESNITCREFFISPHKKVIFNLSRPAFMYYENEHENLISKIRILENMGFVIDITSGNSPNYQFDEFFVDCLLKDK